MNMNKPPDETLKQGRNRSWLLVKNSLNSVIEYEFFIEISVSLFVILNFM